MKTLSPEEMDNVAGGTCNHNTELETIMSITTFGSGCAAAAGIRYFNSGVGQDSEEKGRLCKNLTYKN